MEQHHEGNERILSLTARAERWILIALLAMLLLVVAVGTIELGAKIVTTVIHPSTWADLYGAEALFHIFESFFVVLIGVELLETVRVYLEEDAIHVEAIVLVAITAMARKIIVLDLSKYEPVAIIGLALLVIALCGGFYLLKRGLGKAREGSRGIRT